MARNSTPGHRLRADIQALRGWAILTVLLYHARFAPWPSGFLGVDIFFVISGYLITGMILRDIEKGRFSFLDFYFRRVRRLFPAAFVVFAGAALLAPLLLTAPEREAFDRQLFGALTLTGNIALWKQSGYFDGAAETKPLLHVWSLAIEEQYYLFAPALLFFTPRRYWLRGALMAVAVSFIACLALAPWRPAAVFFLLPTRAFELAIGSVGALATLSAAQNQWLARLFWPALAALVIMPMLPPMGAQPGFAALFICTATLIVILRTHPFFDRPALILLTMLGDISYSLYLVHWPLIAFLRNAWVGAAPLAARLAVVGASLVAAVLLYRFVETPFRKFETSRRLATLAAAAAVSIGLIVAPRIIAPHEAQVVDYAQVRRVNAGLDMSCDYTEAFAPKPACRNAEAPNALLWGDSFAMHLAPGLGDGAPEFTFAQATKSFCGPLLGLAPIARTSAEPYLQQYNRDWARGCIAFNESVLAFLKSDASIRYVVLASRLVQYLDSERFVALRTAPGAFTEEAASQQALHEAALRTIEALRAAGKKVVIVAAPPSAGFDIGQCLERRLTDKPTFGPFASCDIPLAEYKRMSAPVDEALARVRRDANIDVIDFHNALCGDSVCKTFIDDTLLYRDDGHFSIEGSRLAARMTRLTARIIATAR